VEPRERERPYRIIIIHGSRRVNDETNLSISIALANTINNALNRIASVTTLKGGWKSESGGEAKGQ
jgi:hypothetical protein